jgi:hypothetical protein
MPRTANTSQLNLDLPTDLREQLRVRASEEERTITAVVVRAIRRYLDSKKEVEPKIPANKKR